MTRIDRMITDLQKLYAKRSALDTQIQGIEASLVFEAKATSRSALAEKPPAAKKPEAKKSAAPKKPTKK